MPLTLLLAPDDSALPIWFVATSTWTEIAAGLPASARAFAAAQDYTGAAGKGLLLPGPDGDICAAVFGVEDAGARHVDPFLAGGLFALLPEGAWRFANAPRDPQLAVLAMSLAGYAFNRYKSSAKIKQLALQLPDGVDAAEIGRITDGVFLARDLINTPANDLTPADIERATFNLATRFGATVSVVTGDELLRQNFPMVHAVGRASATAPRLIDMVWGNADAPKVTLVGKGVSFDTGGLDIKPSSAMLLMKKDMGGAAAALAAAQMIMAANLPVRLRVLVPAVENAISADAFRPGDVLRSRKGLTVEIGNTDAEGRLILADALALADEEAPDLLFDYATLTGAARVATGPDLPPFYTRDEALAGEIATTGDAVNDPVWRLPLWGAYERLLDSKIADVNHVSSGAFAGSITAALFLGRFVSQTSAWAHFDIFGWTPSAKPGRPEGGEAQAARLTYELVRARYGGKTVSNPSF